jgi:hypothetical protein
MEVNMTMTTTNGQGAPFNGEGSPSDGEDSFMDGFEKLTGILTGLADKLEAHAESLGTSEEEIAELNKGKTEGQIRLEDAIAAQIAAPLVNALDSMSAIINDANEKIMDMIFDEQSDTDE